MNRKRTNRLVAILNVVAIASIFILYFSTNYLLSSMMPGDNGGTSLYGSFIIDTLLNNIQIILILFHGGIGIINIICSIQNKENKKIFFWQIIFGIYEIWAAISLGIFKDTDDALEWGSRIISIIAIILAILNFINIKKNRPKRIQVISYVAVIIIAILDILGILGAYWNVIAIIMQLIYIHYQEKNIEESNLRKIVSIILYYILQFILVVTFVILIISSLLITKINENKLKSELEKLYSTISTLQGATNKEICVPAENNYKYGFINETGIEKIPCEYDRVSYFNEIKINNNIYFIALAKKDNNFYIISKNNDVITIDSTLTKYMQKMYNNLDSSMTKRMNENGDYRLGYLHSFEFIFQALNSFKKTEVTQQTLQKSSNKNKIFLSENNFKYTYKNDKFSMLIEPIYEGIEENDDYYNNYDGNNYYDDKEDTYNFSSYETKYKVTITKNNGETESSVVYLKGIDENEATLATYTNGYIGFKTEDSTRNGWYDLNGNQKSISSKYEIIDIKDDKIISKVSNNNENEKYEINYIVIDMIGNTLLQTTALDIYDNMYLVKNNNKKMVFLDKDLKVISNEYDKIISTMSIDISPSYSSYY